MILGKAKHFTYDTSGFANVLVNNGRGHYLEEGGANVRGQCAGE